MSLKQFYPLHQFSLTALGKLSGAAQGQMGGSFTKKVMFTAFIFLLRQLRGREGAVSSGKSYIHCIYFSLTAMGKLGGSRGQPRGI